MLATILSRAQYGMEAPQVLVEVHVSTGLPAFHIVGLAEAVVKESKDRVRSAIVNSGFEFPNSGRLTVNLAPADLPKEGGRFDLPIALGVLVATGVLPPEAPQGCEFYGELSLGGELRPVRGMLPAVCQATATGHPVILPRSNLDEAFLVERARTAGASSLMEVCDHLKGIQRLEFLKKRPETSPFSYPDLTDVRGQALAKRALEIAATGAHNLLFFGPPGTGKSMLATRLPGILPPMTNQEALETAAVRSIDGRDFLIKDWARRPFRSPHHTTSGVALVGGGSHPRPGEISLAHHGVLFLDELPEFDRHVLEVLRQPLETGTVTISRAGRQADFPACFQLVGAMNPCACGYLGDERCRCTLTQIQKYRGRISGPLLDRIDIYVEMSRPEAAELSKPNHGTEDSATVRRRVVQARKATPNARLTARELELHCPMDDAAALLLEQAIAKLRLSARAYARIRKVARTIADLDGKETIAARHVGEAVQLRRFEITSSR